MKGIKKLFISAAAVISSFLLIGSVPVYGTTMDGATEEISTTSTRNGNIETDDFSIQVKCGLQGNFKMGAPVPVNANIISLKSDFSGVLRIIVPGTSSYDSESIAYEREILLTAGEEKNINLSIRNSNSSAILILQLEDEKGHILVDEKFKFGSQADENALVGIMSDDYTALNYFDQVYISTNNYYGNAKLIELKKDDIPNTSSSLECLSYLIINSYDTSRLSAEQITAIKDWVGIGGVLIIGGGSDYKQTISGLKDWVPFSDCRSTSGEFMYVDSTSSEYEPVIKYEDNGALVIPSIEGAFELSGVISDSTLIADYRYESGHVIMTGFNLGMEPVVSAVTNSGIAAELLSKSANGYSSQRMSNLSYGNYRNNWAIRNVLGNLFESRYPNIVAIVLILFVFVVCGPVLYFILKSKDKREWLWFIIPALSVVFTLAIFLANINIRIKHPVLTSVTTIAEKDDKGVISRDYSVEMSVLTPGTNLEKLPLNKNLHNLSINDNNDDFWGTVNTTSTKNDYTTAVRQTAEGYQINLHNNNTFDYKYFSAELSSENENSKGFDSDMSKTLTGLSGSITNNTGYDMAAGLIISYGTVVPFGNMKNGEKLSFEEKDNIPAYDGDFDRVSFPGITDENLQYIIRQCCQSAYYSYMQQSISTTQNYVYICGVLDNWDADYVNDRKIKENNKAVYIKELLADYQDYTDSVVENLFSYAQYNDSLDINDGQIYQIPAEIDFTVNVLPDQVYALMRAADSAARYGSTDNTKIYGFNWSTGIYEELFTTDLVEKFESGCPYVSETGVMRLKFEAKTAYEDYAPTISIIVGGDNYVGY